MVCLTQPYYIFLKKEINALFAFVISLIPNSVLISLEKISKYCPVIYQLSLFPSVLCTLIMFMLGYLRYFIILVGWVTQLVCLLIVHILLLPPIPIIQLVTSPYNRSDCCMDR